MNLTGQYGQCTWSGKIKLKVYNWGGEKWGKLQWEKRKKENCEWETFKGVMQNSTYLFFSDLIVLQLCVN